MERSLNVESNPWFPHITSWTHCRYSGYIWTGLYPPYLRIVCHSGMGVQAKDDYVYLVMSGNVLSVIGLFAGYLVRLQKT